ncbi:PP2C family protein-serine/threonine phosphatase [Desulfovibrio sp. TomC]|uniref:PP2C family protein-serine/threonine phosphatase n=1 Tax=Desulfovibrio sp. TomC TaxID=1562888 RepID=UPI0005730D14|nr:GAF domain-containing SpoIIE family protein phosphatase [Desulfovibrio sp. TomC]KHK02692.1 Serine phosphatase RsbU, regulator of sigma subunit [Desulfovibrio sp. TomC]
MTQGTPMPDAAGDVTPLARKLDNLRRCFALSRLVAESLDLSEVLARIMTTSRQALGAEAASLLLVDEAPGPGQGELVFTVAQGPACGRLQSGYRLAPGDGVAGWVAATGQAALLPDAYQDPRFNRNVDQETGYRTRSMVCVPLIYRERIVGVVQCMNKIGGGEFTPDDLEICSLLGAQAAVAIVNARLHGEALAKQRMDFDMEVAASVQQGFWPKDAPALSGFDVAGVSLPCDATGGDYYDYLMRPDCGREGLFLVAVGDVTGHGIQAALLMASVRAFLRSRLLSPGSPGEIVSDVNRLLTADMGTSGRFITLFLLELCPAAGELRYVRAGHDPALLYDPGRDDFLELGGRGIPLGIDSDWCYEENVVQGLPAGAVLALGTDGIWEARGQGGEMYGKTRLRHALRRAAAGDAGSIARAVLADLSAFTQGEPRHDDITLVVIKALPGAKHTEAA